MYILWYILYIYYYFSCISLIVCILLVAYILLLVLREPGDDLGMLKDINMYSYANPCQFIKRAVHLQMGISERSWTRVRRSATGYLGMTDSQMNTNSLKLRISRLDFLIEVCAYVYVWQER